MKSHRIQSVLLMSKRYGRPPSQLLGIEDEYTAFCFDEACCSFMTRLEEGENPQYELLGGKEEDNHYSDFMSLYKKIEE